MTNCSPLVRRAPDHEHLQGNLALVPVCGVGQKKQGSCPKYSGVGFTAASSYKLNSASRMKTLSLRVLIIGCYPLRWRTQKPTPDAEYPSPSPFPSPSRAHWAFRAQLQRGCRGRAPPGAASGGRLGNEWRWKMFDETAWKMSVFEGVIENKKRSVENMVRIAHR